MIQALIQELTEDLPHGNMLNQLPYEILSKIVSLKIQLEEFDEEKKILNNINANNSRPWRCAMGNFPAMRVAFCTIPINILCHDICGIIKTMCGFLYLTVNFSTFADLFMWRTMIHSYEFLDDSIGTTLYLYQDQIGEKRIVIDFGGELQARKFFYEYKAHPDIKYEFTPVPDTGWILLGSHPMGFDKNSYMSIAM